MLKSAIQVLVIILLLAPTGNGFKILFVSFISTTSHMITFRTLLEELAARGHEVTILSPQKPATVTVPNLREILTKDAEEFINEFIPDYRKLNKTGVVKNEFKTGDLILKACEMTYDLPQVKQILTERFDLVILPSTTNACAAGYVYKLNATLVLGSLVTAFDWIPSPPGGIFNSFFGRVGFLDRVSTFIQQARFNILDSLYYKPAAAALYREKLNDPSIPSVEEIFGKASLILSNTHFSVDIPRPLLPDVIEILGIHCREPRTLPTEMEALINSDRYDGFILFSMGSGLSGKSLSDGTTQMLIRIFSEMKQLILWKWEGDLLEGLPKNVKQFKWLPQQDLLGHLKIKGFLCQGGLLSVTEAIYHGVPMLGIPIVADQFLNMERVEEFGIGISMKFEDLAAEGLRTGLQKIINEPKYRENARHRSKLFRDQLNKPIERAVYWIEYVARYGGAPHLRSPSRDLNYFQFNGLDLYLSSLVLFLTIISVIVITIRNCLRKCRTMFSKKKKEKRRKDKGN